MTRVLLAFFMLLAAAGAAAQGIYRWVDERGKVHYGSEPPPSAKASTVRERINSYGGTPQVQRAPASAPAAAAAPAGQAVMYSTSWCGYCAQARQYFARKGIPYVEHDVEKSASANAEHKRLGGKGVPLILYGGEVMRGFSESAFETLLARERR